MGLLRQYFARVILLERTPQGSQSYIPAWSDDRGIPIDSTHMGATPNQTSWAILVSQQGSVPLTLRTLSRQIQNTMEVSIPTITGSPFCHVDEFSVYKILGFEASQAPSWQCHVIGVSWSLVYLFLLALSGGLKHLFLEKEMACPPTGDRDAQRET